MIKSLLIFLSCLVLFVACSKDSNAPSFIYGNLKKNNNYQGQGKIYTTLATVEEVDGSDIKYFVGTPLAIPGNKLVSSTNANTVALLMGRKIQWEYSLPDDGYPVTDFSYSNGKIFFATSDTSICALDLKGRLVSETKLEGVSSLLFSDPIVVSGNVYIANYDGSIFKLDTSFIKKDKVNLGGSVELNLSYSNDNILISHHGKEADALLYLDDKLKIDNKFELGVGSEIINFPVAGDSLVVILERKEIKNEYYYNTIALDFNANKKWARQTTLLPRHVSIDSEDNSYVVYVSSGMGQSISNIIKFDDNGEQQATFNIDHLIPKPIILADDHPAFIAIKGENTGLFYLKEPELILFDILDLTNRNLLNSFPAITNSNTLKFTSKTNSRIVRVKSGFLDFY